MDTKRCSTCGEVKLVDQFNKHTKSKDGLKSYCKQCRSNEYHRNKDRYSETNRQWAEAHPGFWTAYRRKWNKNNRERYLNTARRFYYRHREKCLAYWNERPEQRREYHRRWRDNNRAMHNSKEQRRRARKAAVGGSYTAEEWITLCNQYGNKCLACGKAEGLTVDHVIPLKRGGRNDISNLQPLCRSCNSRKGSRVIDYRIRKEQ